MNQTIWKFPINSFDKSSIAMPIGAEILSVQNQNENICLWALVDPSVDKEFRTIEIVGTGHAIHYYTNTSMKYISTFQINKEQLVFHAFEIIEI